jgi:hypothetical protein
MLVIGIDPGTFKTGIASVNSAEQARMATLFVATDVPYRYGMLRDHLADFLVELEEDPAVIAIEPPKEVPNPGDPKEEIRRVIRLNCIYAVIISEVSRLWPHTPILALSPSIWRRPNETKEDVAYRMSVKYGVDFETDDESDALGIADYAMIRLLGGDKSIEALKL